jgi:hypothetical protein
MTRQPPREPAQFVPCHPPAVVQDRTLGGRPVLLLGWWVDAHGKPVEVEVATFASTRRSFEIGQFPRPPRSAMPAAPGAFVPEVSDAQKTDA